MRQLGEPQDSAHSLGWHPPNVFPAISSSGVNPSWAPALIVGAGIVTETDGRWASITAIAPLSYHRSRQVCPTRGRRLAGHQSRISSFLENLLDE